LAKIVNFYLSVVKSRQLYQLRSEDVKPVFGIKSASISGLKYVYAPSFIGT